MTAMFNTDTLPLGYWGDDVILIDFDKPPGEVAQVKDIRQIITYGDLAREYSRDNNPYTHYESSWNKKHGQLLAYRSVNGFDGLSGLYWVHPDHQHWLATAAEKHLHYLREGWIKELPVLQALPQLPMDLENALKTASETDSGIIYCSVEDDYYIDEVDQVESPHLIWVDSEAIWGGCGAEEGKLSTNDLETQLFPLLDLAGKPNVLALKAALEAHSYSINARTILTVDQNISGRNPNFGRTEYCRSHCADELDEETINQCEMAIAWLNSLRSGITQNEDLITANWIEAWLKLKQQD